MKRMIIATEEYSLSWLNDPKIYEDLVAFFQKHA